MNNKNIKIIHMRRLVALIRKKNRTSEDNFKISRLKQKLALIDFKANKPYRDKKDLKNQRTVNGER